MKIKRTMYLAMLGAVCLLSGCGQKQGTGNENRTSAPSQTAASVDESSPAEIIIDVPAEQETGSGDVGQILYLGTWEITACRGTAAVYAMSQDEIDGMIGRTVTYQADKFYYDGNTEGDAVTYHEEMVTDSQLSEDFNVVFSGLGIADSELLHVEAKGIEGNFFGTYFYVLGENTLMIYYEGVFFEAVRV